MRSLVATALVAATSLAPFAAHAATVSDGADFSVVLPSRSLCFVKPKPLRDPATCHGLDLAPYEATLDEKPDVIALGILWLDPADVDPSGTVSVVRRRNEIAPIVDEAYAREYLSAAEANLRLHLEPTTKIASTARIVMPSRISLVRITIDVTKEGEDDDPLSSHHVQHAAFARDGSWHAVEWRGLATAAKQLDVFADVAAASITVTQPARTKRPVVSIATILPLSVFGLVGLVFFVLWRILKRQGSRQPTNPAKK